MGVALTQSLVSSPTSDSSFELSKMVSGTEAMAGMLMTVPLLFERPSFKLELCVAIDELAVLESGNINRVRFLIEVTSFANICKHWLLSKILEAAVIIAFTRSSTFKKYNLAW